MFLSQLLTYFKATWNVFYVVYLFIFLRSKSFRKNIHIKKQMLLHVIIFLKLLTDVK